MDFKKKISDLKSLDYKELLPRLKDYFANFDCNIYYNQFWVERQGNDLS